MGYTGVKWGSMQVRVAMAAQELLSCGEKWNQGCDGGFPFLASKYSLSPTVVVGPVTASPSTVGLRQCSLRPQTVCALVGLRIAVVLPAGSR